MKIAEQLLFFISATVFNGNYSVFQSVPFTVHLSDQTSDQKVCCAKRLRKEKNDVAS